jgi:hypothetical protein
MATVTQTKTFTVNNLSIPLTTGDEITYKLSLTSTVINNNFTASISRGNLSIHSLATLVGYSQTDCPYFDGNIGVFNKNTLIFNAGITSFYNNNYLFAPNPLTGSLSSLYDTYGDIDYPFVSKPFDIILLFLSDGTYLEARVIDIYLNPIDNLLTVKLDIVLSTFAISDLNNNTYKKFLWLTRKDDETNTYLTFTKRPGTTSYGFLIPENLSPDVLANIDTITKQVKQKLIGDQGNVIGDLTGGGF